MSKYDDSLVKKLADKIFDLPIEYQSIIFLRYLYGYSFLELEEVFEIAEPENKLMFIKVLLADFLSMDEYEISEGLIKDSARLVLERIESASKEMLSDSEFTKDKSKLVSLDLKLARRKKNFFAKFSRFAAVFVLGTLLIFGVDSLAGGRLYSWIVSDYKDYSVFESDEESDIRLEDVDISIGYIPKGYELEEEYLHRKKAYITYTNNNGGVIDIEFSEDLSTANIDTEDAKLWNIELGTSIAYRISKSYTSKEGEMYHCETIIVNYNGIDCYIFSNNGEDVEEIAKNIKVDFKK